MYEIMCTISESQRSYLNFIYHASQLMNINLLQQSDEAMEGSYHKTLRNSLRHSTSENVNSIFLLLELIDT